MNGLREDLLRVEEQMAALAERVDFTDKLLLSGDDPGLPPSSD